MNSFYCLNFISIFVFAHYSGKKSIVNFVKLIPKCLCALKRLFELLCQIFFTTKTTHVWLYSICDMIRSAWLTRSCYKTNEGDKINSFLISHYATEMIITYVINWPKSTAMMEIHLIIFISSSRKFKLYNKNLARVVRSVGFDELYKPYYKTLIYSEEDSCLTDISNRLHYHNKSAFFINNFHKKPTLICTTSTNWICYDFSRDMKIC